MKNPVIIELNPNTNEVLTSKEIPDGLTGEMKTVHTLRVSQTAMTMRGNFMHTSKRSAFVTLENDHVEFFGSQLAENNVFPMEGHIVIEETLEPYVSKSGKKQEPKMNPQTEEVLKFNGQPIYMNSRFSTNLAEKDVLIKANKVVPTDDFDSGEEVPE